MCILKDEERENTFTIHLLFIEGAMVNWEPYIAYLTRDTNEGVNHLPCLSTDVLLTHLYVEWVIVTSFDNGADDQKDQDSLS